MNPSPPKAMPTSDERGAALVTSLLVLLLLSVLATGGFWLSRSEVAAAQGYSQGVRTLFLAEAGMARYFASSPAPEADSMWFAYYNDPCDDTLQYPTVQERNDCRAAGDSEAEEFLEEWGLRPPPSAAYAFVNADVYITSQFIVSDGSIRTYEVSAEARVRDRQNPDLLTSRVLDRFARFGPPFTIQSVYAATGGLVVAGGSSHVHMDSKAKAGKDGSCGSDLVMPHIQTPSGLFSAPSGIPEKWHMKGDGEEVDSTFASGSGIITNMGLDWSDFLNDSYFDGITDVVTMNDSNFFMTYFDDSKSKDFKEALSWPITRYDGDITTDKRVKGYGLLIVTGDVYITKDKLEWMGLMLVGGNVYVDPSAHFHVKGGLVDGLSCTEAERAAGLCRSDMGGDHVDMKYRPCEITQAWSRLMTLQPVDDLYRESSPPDIF